MTTLNIEFKYPVENYHDKSFKVKKTLKVSFEFDENVEAEAQLKKISDYINSKDFTKGLNKIKASALAK